MRKQTTWAAMLLVMVLAASCKKSKDTDTGEKPPVEVEAEPISLTDLRALSTGTSVTLPDAKKISGVVISDAGGKNIDPKQAVLQEGDGKPGIIINFADNVSFASGDQLEVVVSKQTLAQVDGEVVLQDIPVANAKKTGTGTVNPRETSAAELAGHAAEWNGTLVKLPAGAFAGDGTFSGELAYTDASGTVKSTILAGAAFEGQAYPALINAVTGILRSKGQDVYVDLRKAADAQTALGFVLTEDFQQSTFLPMPAAGQTDYIAWTPSWANAMVLSTGKWGYYNVNAFKAEETKDKTFSSRAVILRMLGTANGLGTADFLTFNINSQQFDGFEDPGFEYGDLKTISITYAGSTEMPLTEVSDNGTLSLKTGTAAFDPAKDTIGIRLWLYDGPYGNVILDAPGFKDVGKFHTVTFTLDPDALQAGGIYPDGYPAFWIQNTSSVRETISGSYFDLTTPLVIDKVEFGFAEKPAGLQ